MSSLSDEILHLVFRAPLASDQGQLESETSEHDLLPTDVMKLYN